MITGLGERIDEHSENFNEKLENILKKNRTEEYSNWGGGKENWRKEQQTRSYRGLHK